MKTICLLIAALLASALVSSAGLHDSKVTFLKESVRVDLVLPPQGERGNPNNPLKPPKTLPGGGTDVYYPLDDMYDNPGLVKMSAEIVRTDEVGNPARALYPINRFNLSSLMVTAHVVLDQDRSVNHMNLVLYDYAMTGFVFTNETESPDYNLGALIIPYDKDGNVVEELVGKSIADPEPYVMNSGTFNVRSVDIDVYKVKIKYLPLYFDSLEQEYFEQVRGRNPDKTIGLLLDISAIVEYAMSPTEGCVKYPDCNEIQSKTMLTFTPKTPAIDLLPFDNKCDSLRVRYGNDYQLEWSPNLETWELVQGHMATVDIV